LCLEDGKNEKREIWDSQSSVAEGSSFLECEAVSLNEQLSTFRSIVVFSFSLSSRPKRTAAQESRVYCISENTNIMLPEDERIAIFRNVENYNPNDTASHPRILESFLTNRFLRNAGRTTHQTARHPYSSVLKPETTDVSEKLLPVSRTGRHHSLAVTVRISFPSYDILLLFVIMQDPSRLIALLPSYFSFKVKFSLCIN
jgi:hypothetical protein